jgi:deoxyxylulose-5-phosphate synthase
VQIIVPADESQARSALRATYGVPHPVYYRISKNESSDIPGLGANYDAETIDVIHRGEDALIIVAGPIAREALKAAEILAERGVRAAVAVISSLQPAPLEALGHYLTALEHQPNATAQFNLGLAHMALGDFAAARQVYAQGIERFGAEEAQKVGAVSDLRALLAQSSSAVEIRQLLNEFWPQ